jgi:hypothetical protein
VTSRADQVRQRAAHCDQKSADHLSQVLRIETCRKRRHNNRSSRGRWADRYDLAYHGPSYVKDSWATDHDRKCWRRGRNHWTGRVVRAEPDGYRCSSTMSDYRRPLLSQDVLNLLLQLDAVMQPEAFRCGHEDAREAPVRMGHPSARRNRWAMSGMLALMLRLGRRVGPLTGCRWFNALQVWG